MFISIILKNLETLKNLKTHRDSA